MLIDFHAHIFTDALAPKARAVLMENSHGAYTHCTDMTLGGLLGYMNAHGVDKSVVLPIVTKQHQTETINRWAASINDGDRIVSFGSVFPHTDDYRRDIDLVVSLGLKGIKLHPEYQAFDADEESLMPLYEYAAEKGLIIVWHAGYDPIGTPPYRSNPHMFARLADRLAGAKLVAAHLGGQEQWEDVYDVLAGRDIYLDTSMASKYCPQALFEAIVEKHGADKILFASDSPWSDAAEEVKRLKTYNFTSDKLEKMFHLNAEKLLGLRA